MTACLLQSKLNMMQIKTHFKQKLSLLVGLVILNLSCRLF